MLTIGKLAALAEITADTLRYYEREKLIRPAKKSKGGYRLYDADSAPRIRFIKQVQCCGFTLAEIRQLLALRYHETAHDDDERRWMVEKKLQLKDKLRTIRYISKVLDDLIADNAA
jgi:DNA-binding transcriptional MerR regulator